MIAGTLEIQILAQLARLADDMHKAQGMVGGAMKNIERSVAQAKSVLASLGVGLSIGYFAHLIKGSIDAADHLGDLSKSTGIAVKDLAGLNLLAKQSGTDLDSLAKAINKMSVEMGKDPEKFRALGVTAKGNKEALMQFADVFGQLPDIQQRNALAQAVFGKSWAELAPVLAEGGRNIGEIIDKGARLSGNTQQMTDDADRFNDQMAELNITLGATWTKLAGDLLPGMNDISEAMREAAKEGGILLTIWVAMGGAMANLLGMTDKQQAAKRLTEINEQLAIANKQLQAGSLKPSGTGSHLFSFLVPDIKLGEDAITKLRANIAALEKEKARLMPQEAAAPKGADKAAEASAAKRAQDFLDAEKIRAANLAAEKKAAAEIAAANKKTADESAKYWEEFQKNVQRNLGDVLYLGLQGKFRDIGDLFKQLMLRMTADAAAAQITKAMFGGAGMGAAMFGSAAVAATGTTAAAPATAGLLGVGGVAAMTPAMIAGAAVVGGLLLAKYGFGMGNDREYGPQRLVGQFTRGGFTGNRQQSWTQDGGWFGGDSGGTITTAIGRAESKLFAQTVDSLQHTFNQLGDAIGYASVRTRGWTVNINAAGDVTGLLADGIGAQLVPSLELLRNAGENLAQTAQRITDAFVSTTQFIAGLGVGEDSAFGALGIASAEARLKLIAAAGGLQNFTTLAGQFASSILTPFERLQVSLEAVGSTFARLGILGIETNEQFAALVKTELQLGRYDIVAQLLNVSGAFGTVTQAAADTTAQLLALIKTDTFSTMVDYQRAVGRARNAAGAPSISAATDAAAEQLPAIEAANAAKNAKDAALLQEEKESAARVAKKSAVYNEVLRLERVYKEILGTTGMFSLATLKASKAYLLMLDYYKSLPSYASGNPYVASDMTANIHRGEMVVDAQSASAMRRYGMGSGNEALVAEIRALNAKFAQLISSSESTASSTRGTHNLLRNVTRDGQSLLTEAA